MNAPLLCHPMPHSTLSQADNLKTMPIIVQFQNCLNADTCFLLYPGILWRDERDWLVALGTGRRQGSMLIRVEETSKSSIEGIKACC